LILRVLDDKKKLVDLHDREEQPLDQPVSSDSEYSPRQVEEIFDQVSGTNFIISDEQFLQGETVENLLNILSVNMMGE